MYENIKELPIFKNYINRYIKQHIYMATMLLTLIIVTGIYGFIMYNKSGYYIGGLICTIGALIIFAIFTFLEFIRPIIKVKTAVQIKECEIKRIYTKPIAHPNSSVENYSYAYGIALKDSSDNQDDSDKIYIAKAIKDDGSFNYKECLYKEGNKLYAIIINKNIYMGLINLKTEE